MRGANRTVEQRDKEPGRRSGWVSLLLIAVFAVLICTTGYFAFRYVDRSTFNDARAFRVLDELVGQFDNFQQTMAGLLAIAPEIEDKEAYKQASVLPDLELNRSDKSCDPSSGSANPERLNFELQRRNSKHSFSISRCVSILIGEDNADFRNLKYRQLTLSGAISTLLPAFVSQEFFDVALIGSRQGEFLIDVSKRNNLLGAVQIQQTRSAGVLIADVNDLLRRGALEIARTQAVKKERDKTEKNAEDAVDVSKFAAPSHPVVFQDRIAGETYRIYVMAFRPNIAMSFHPTTATEPARQPKGSAAQESSAEPEQFSSELLYMVGLKRQSWTEQLSAGLGPSGSFAITITVLLVIVLWPLVSLRFAAPQDPIPRMQVVALSIAALLLPAILAVAAVWAWNNLHLRIWADSAAEVYAKQLDDVLRAELSESAGLLDEYAVNFYAPREVERRTKNKPGTPPDFPRLPIRHQRTDPTTGAQRELPSCLETKAASIGEPVLLMRAKGKEDKGKDECPLRNWSPLHSVSALDTEGKTPTLDMERTPEHRLTAFGTVLYRRTLDIHDREYFRAILAYEEWLPNSDVWQQNQIPTHGFVAQRLFNRGDAARVLQIAVPLKLKHGHGHESERLGIVTADTRAYAISSALRVPLLRFAVVNASNGAVLFHSNDERSLAENFLLETEHDPLLQRALVRRASRFSLNKVTGEDHFTGNYMGTTHRFYYRPVAGVPWGIVVFYPVAEIAVVAQQAATAALAGYMSIIIALVALLIIIFALMPNRVDLILLSLTWPQWEGRGTYRAVACCVAVITIALVAMLLWKLNAQFAPGGYWWLAVAAICCALCLRLWKSANKKEMALRTYQAWYLACMVLVMLLASALPAAWMATSYQDVALRAYFRDQLTQAATDLERRELAIARDLRRWVPLEDERTDEYPDAQVLSRILSSPGYTNATYTNATKDECTVWTVTTFDQQPWMSERGPPTLWLFGRIVWAMSIDSNLQRAGRTKLFDPEAVKPESDVDAVNTVAKRATYHETPRTANFAGSPACRRDDKHIPYWRRSFNGTTSQFLVPVAARRQTSLQRDFDIEAHYDHSPTVVGFALLLILVLLLVLVSWIMARRLFGIRIPFASRFVDRVLADSMPVEPLLSVELEIAALEKKFGTSFTVKDGDDIRMARCKSIYSDIWRKRSQDQRLLLHQLAEGKFANPENQGVIEELLHLGFLKLDPWPKISDRGLAAYARHAEKDALFAKWQQAASASTWNSIRTPLLLVVIVIVAILMWMAGSTMQILSATLAGMATLFGYVTQVTNLFKKGSESSRNE